MASRFNAATNAEDVVAGIDLRGKVAIVTGSSAGVGAETARVLAKTGAEVVMVARDAAKNARVAERIRAEVPGARLTLARMDLADLADVRRAAAEIQESHPKIDILINNAGFVGGPLTYTKEGCELHFGANHIGPFLFTNLLVPALKAAAPSRIVVVSSNGHRTGGLDWNDLQFRQRSYNHWSAYSQSKACNMLFVTALAQRLKPFGVTVNGVHPGVIVTEVFRSVTPDEEKMVTNYSESNGSPVKTIAQGAATQVWGAVAPELADVTGQYLEDCDVAEVKPFPEFAWGVLAEVLDPQKADRMWAISEEIVGQSFAFG